MNEATATTEVTESTTVVVTTAANEAAKTEAKAPKAPSKKSQAQEIFNAKLALRAEGKFESNKDFRAAVMREIESVLNVSTASAATMYNTFKVEAEAANPEIGLGRDPKKEKAPAANAGKRGRPAGSKNKPKETEAAASTETLTTETPAGETNLDLSALQPEPKVLELVAGEATAGEPASVQTQDAAA